MTRKHFAMIGVAVLAVSIALLSAPKYMKLSEDVAETVTVTEQAVTESAKPQATGKTVDAVKTREPAPPADQTAGRQRLDYDDDLSGSRKNELAEVEMDEVRPQAEPAEAPTIAASPAPPRKVMQEKRALSVAGGYAESSRVGGITVAPPMPEGEGGNTYYQDEGRDKFEKITPSQVKLVTEEPVSTFSIDVDTASYAFVRRQLNHGVLPQKNAVRVEELINYFDYDYPVPPDRSQPFAPTVAVYPSPWNKHNKLLHIGIKGYDIEPDEKPRSNLVFLLDVSGSMNSPDKLPLLKNSMAMLVDTLAPEDTVAIAVYAGAAGAVLDPTPVKEKGKILAALDRLRAGGSTAGGAGIKLAYSLARANLQKDAVNRVILATDGDFNVGITNQEELKSYIERERETGIFLSVLGFGQGNYNDALMQTLAQNGNGNAAYIDSLSEARKVLVDEATSTLFTIAKDVKIQIEFNPARVKEYRLIGYETRMLQREDFKDDRVDAGDVGAGHSVTAIYEITPKGSEGGLIEDLRYQDEEKEAAAPSSGNEYAFLKMRYKLPDATTSKLITTPVDAEAEYRELANVPGEIRFAAAVAGFGQLLRGESHMRDFSYDDVIELGRAAKGEDMFGYRSEFFNLVRLAKTARKL